MYKDLWSRKVNVKILIAIFMKYYFKFLNMSLSSMTGQTDSSLSVQRLNQISLLQDSLVLRLILFFVCIESKHPSRCSDAVRLKSSSKRQQRKSSVCLHVNSAELLSFVLKDATTMKTLRTE